MSLSTTPKRTLDKRIKDRKLPNLEVPQTGNEQLDRALMGVAEHLRLYEGDSGAPKERFVSLEELEAAGMVDLTVKRGFASISGIFGEPVQRVKSTKTSTVPPTGGSGMGGGASGPKIWSDLRDVNTPTRIARSMAYFNGGAWTDTGEFLKWDPDNGYLQLANSYTINWLTDTDVSVEFLDFEVLIAPSEVEIDHYSNEINSIVSVADNTTYQIIHTVISGGTLIAGDDYLVVAKTWFSSESGASADQDADNAIKFSYGNLSLTSAVMAARNDQTGSTPYYGDELSGAKVITADASSALLLKAKTAPAPNNKVQARISQAWALNLTQLGLDNYIPKTTVANGTLINNTVDTWTDVGAAYTIGDGVSDYVLFISYEVTIDDSSIGNSPDYVASLRVSGGPWTDAELFQVGEANQRNNSSYSVVGILLMEAPVEGTELQFQGRWSSAGGFDNTHGGVSIGVAVTALRLNDFVDYMIVSSADLSDPGGAGEVEVLNGSFTSSATSGDWGFLGGLSSYFPSSSRDALSEIRVDINSGGDNDAADTQDVAQSGDASDRTLQALIPIGTETNINSGDDVEFGMFVNTAPNTGSDAWDAAGVVAFSYYAVVVTNTFIVGDASYKTLIDGSEVVVDSALNVTGTVDFDSALNVDGVVDFNDDVELNDSTLGVHGATDANVVTFAHDDTDFNIAGANTTDLNFTGFSAIDFAGPLTSITAVPAGIITLSNFDVDVRDIVEVAGELQLDTAEVTVSSDGAVITFQVEKEDGGDIRILFIDGVFTLDSDPTPVTIALTAGDDDDPQINYIYILQSTKEITKSTSGWPAGEHSRLATVLCQSAASMQTDGAYKLHAWTDHTDSEIAHIAFWLRSQSATWVSGTLLTPTVGAATFDIAVATGKFLQLHPHDYPAFNTSTGSEVMMVNDFTTSFLRVGNLVNQITDANNVSMSGKYYNLVIWGVISQDDGDCQLMVNLPTASYNNSASAILDADGTSVYDIPSDFKGVGFLIARLTVRHQVGGNTYSISQNTDLRGKFPSISAGGTTGGGVTSFGDLSDGDTTGWSQDDLLVFNGAGVIVPTAGALTWSGSTLFTSGNVNVLGHSTNLFEGETRFRNDGGTDWLALSHDGIDFNFAFTNTQDANFTGANVYKFDGRIDASITVVNTTTAALEDIGNVINTAINKRKGTMLYNSDTSQPVWALGSSHGSVWKDAAGNTVHTPV